MTTHNYNNIISSELAVNSDNTVIKITPNGNTDIDYYVPVAHITGVKLKPANNTSRDKTHKIIIDTLGTEGATMLLYDDKKEAERCANALSDIITKFYE